MKVHELKIKLAFIRTNDPDKKVYYLIQVENSKSIKQKSCLENKYDKCVDIETCQSIRCTV